MKNKILNRLSIIISSVLSFTGILAGNFACAYGPPGGSEEEYYKLNQLKEEVQELQDKLNKKKDEEYYIQKDIAKYKYEIKLLETEKDSLKILIKEFDK